MGRLEDQVIVITGAAKGQGEVEAERCAAEGAQVVVADVLVDEGRQVAARVGGVFQKLDVSSADDWAALVRATDRIDGLVNNAGVFRALSMQQTDEATFRRLFEINQLGVFLGMQAVAPVMASSGGGSIVNISSIAGMRGVPAFAYVSTKWAVRGMTKTAARELGPQGIRVNSIHPGVVQTDMLQETPPERLDELAGMTPLGRVGQPGDIAGPVVFLLSKESDYMTGAELTVDGGTIA